MFHIIVSGRGVVIVADIEMELADGIPVATEIVDDHTEALVKVDGILDVPAVEQESLLCIVKRLPRITENRVHTCVESRVGLILVTVGVVAEGVGSAEVVFRTGVVDGRIGLAVDPHFCLAFAPTAVCTVDADAEGDAVQSAAALDVVKQNIGSACLYGMLLPECRVEIFNLFFVQFPFPAGNHPVVGFCNGTAVLDGDLAVLFERHLQVAVAALTGCDHHLGGAEGEELAILIFQIHRIVVAEKRCKGDFHGRKLVMIPINADDEVLANEAAEPHVGDHAGTVGVEDRRGLACADTTA